MNTTHLLVALYLGLQAAFIWARFAVFRIDGPAPVGVRVIEASATASILIGTALIASRQPAYPALDHVALLLAGCSIALFTAGVRTVRRRQLTAAFSPDLPTELLTTGAFRWIRNPFYLSYLLAHALPVVATRSVWAFACLAWMTGVYVRAALAEERKFLASPLANEYGRYVRRTGRFLPRLFWNRGVARRPL